MHGKSCRAAGEIVPRVVALVLKALPANVGFIQYVRGGHFHAQTTRGVGKTVAIHSRDAMSEQL